MHPVGPRWSRGRSDPVTALEQDYFQKIADILLNPPPDGAPPSTRDRYERVAFDTAKLFGVAGNEDSRKKGLSLKHRNLVIERIGECNDFISRATALGYAPPENPFARIAAANVDRELFEGCDFPPDDELKQIFVSLFQLNKLVVAEKKGQVDLDKSITNSAQLSSLTITTDGLGIGDSSELAGFVPDADAIKRRQALGSIAKLDFSRRVPSLVFLADYSPDGRTRGIIVGWRRMPDASGYIIKRHDITRNKDVEMSFSNSMIDSTMPTYERYVREYVLSFYRKEQTKNIVYIVDKSVLPDSLYVYEVQAYQEIKLRPDTVFDTPTVVVAVSPKQINRIRASIQAEIKAKAPGQLEVDDVSPYSHISQELYGSPDYGWVLAAANVIASTDRRDPVERIRKYSFIGSKFSELSAEIEAGRFVAPADLNVVARSFRDALASFGIEKILAEVLDKTGALFFFGDKDTLAGGTIDERAGMLARMLASIDPETATVDPLVLKSNVSVPLERDPASFSTATPAQPIDISSDETTSRATADSEAVFASFSVDTDIDLLTFEGMGQLMGILRDFYDFSSREAT